MWSTQNPCLTQTDSQEKNLESSSSPKKLEVVKETDTCSFEIIRMCLSFIYAETSDGDMQMFSGPDELKYLNNVRSFLFSSPPYQIRYIWNP